MFFFRARRMHPMELALDQMGVGRGHGAGGQARGGEGRVSAGGCGGCGCRQVAGGIGGARGQRMPAAQAEQAARRNLAVGTSPGLQREEAGDAGDAGDVQPLPPPSPPAPSRT